jgi:hypothetical protein
MLQDSASEKVAGHRHTGPNPADLACELLAS